MKKLNGESMNIVDENIAKLKELFPDVFSEGKIDFEVLEATLGKYVEDKSERYNFTWNGKSMARRIAQTSSTGTLRPCYEESKDWDTTQNLYIEGDNLEVLKLLQKSYHKKVKMIYIDPPYNTGKDFVYKDNFRDNIKNYMQITGQVDSEGNRLSTNSETNGRYHSDWLNMMYPRLKLARNLLKDDGVIFISIDDNEVANLQKLCNEIFGEDNLINIIPWKGKGGGADNKFLMVAHEYILCYAKSKNNFIIGEEKKEGEVFSKYDSIKKRKYKTQLVRKWGSNSRREDRPNLFYSVKTPDNSDVYPMLPNGDDGRWRWSRTRLEEAIKNNDIDFIQDSNEWVLYEKIYEPLEGEFNTKKFSTWLDYVGNTAEGSKEIKKIFDEQKLFDFPKPVSLIDILIKVSNTTDDDLILDFFSGSATTAHAVMKLNSEDDGNRKFICVQLPETTDEKSEAFKAGYKNICEIGKERIRRAGEKIKGELKIEDGELRDKLDIGFKVFKLDSSNIKTWDSDFDNLEANLIDAIDNIKSDRTSDDLLYEILLKYGLDLTLPMDELEVNGKKVFSIGYGSLVVCLDDEITLETVEGIAKLKDESDAFMRVVFKDSGFKDSSIKTNAIEILKQHGIDEMKSV